MMKKSEFDFGTLKNTETLAFAVWRTDVADSFKRMIMLEIRKLVENRHNQPSSKVLWELKRRLPNVSEQDYMDAVAALKKFGAVGLFQIKNVPNAYHINASHSKRWDAYVEMLKVEHPYLFQQGE